MFWANLSTALGDVTHAQAVFFLRLLLTVTQHIKWVHIEFGDTNEESWTCKRFLILFMIANYVASVLT